MSRSCPSLLFTALVALGLLFVPVVQTHGQIDISSNAAEKQRQQQVRIDRFDEGQARIRGSGWDPQPFLSKSDCERTRQIDYKHTPTGSERNQPTYRDEMELCYGLNFPAPYRVSVLEVCAKFQVDFNKPCRVTGRKQSLVPLALAVEHLDDTAVLLLLERGANAKIGNLIHRLPYTESSEMRGGSFWPNPRKYRRILHALVKAGANIDAPGFEQDPEGDNLPWLFGTSRADTPFKFASKRNEIGAAIALLEAGADINATADSACTALDDAYETNYSGTNAALIEFIEKRGGKRAVRCAVNKATFNAARGIGKAILEPFCATILPCRAY